MPVHLRSRTKKANDANESNSSSEEFDIADTRKEFIRLGRLCSIKYDHIKKFINKFRDPSEISIFDLESRVIILTELHKNYDQLLELLVDLNEDAEYANFCSETEILNANVLETLSFLKNLIHNKKKSEMTDEKKVEVNNHGSNYVSRKPKLPNLPIPSFNGNPGEWIPFRNTYVALIHNDPDLSGVVKFSYLLDRLNQETKSLLGTITLSDEGYETAWKQLLERFDNKRLIIDHHIESLLNLPNAARDNFKDLQKLINTCVSNVSALESSNQNLNGLGEQILINLVLKKIDYSLRKEWENELTSSELPGWKNLLSFLQKKCRVLESVDSSKKVTSSHAASKPFKPTWNANTKNVKTSFMTQNADKKSSNQSHSNTKQWSQSTKSQETCQICHKANHLVYDCPDFLLMSTYDRFNKIKELKFCINCLRFHPSNNCKSRGCKICSDNHHTMLHHVQQKSNHDSSASNSTLPSTSQGLSNQLTFFAEKSVTPQTVILPTAIVMLKDKFGKYRECRALLDSCSDANYITNDFADVLKLDKLPNSVTITGLNQTKSSSGGLIRTHLKSKFNPFERQMSFSVIPVISHTVPSSSFNISNWDIPKNLILADPDFNTSRPIDILIGGELFFEAISNNKFKIKDNLPYFVESIFGWIITGRMDTSTLNNSNSMNFCLTQFQNRPKPVDLQESLSKFFEVDPVIDKKHLSKEELSCEKHFQENHFRDESGKYTVSIPFRDNVTSLGESRSQALNRFKSLEKKLNANPDFKQEYTKVIDEYLSLGHMREITSEESQTLPNYYMPHHAVVKPSSTTTKVRVVFDASAKSSSQLSLNEAMLVGPTVQQTSFEITLRFRKYRFVFTSDINKMYRQIRLDPTQTPFHRILWRPNSDSDIRTYELLTVTFGTACAPYLATRTLNQLAMDESTNYPDASKVTQRDFYVDDVLTGTDNIEDAILLQKQLSELLSRGGFRLHKWCSNNSEILSNIPIQDREILKNNSSSAIECIKALGLTWLPNQDLFTFVIPSMEIIENVTKRMVVSEVAKLYDPLGLLAPVVITAKILIQELWKTHSDWDDVIPPHVQQLWQQYRSAFSSLNELKIDRWIMCAQPKLVQIHGYADASEKAYGACVYVRTIDEHDNIHVKLVCSKSRVAPIKQLSLPRLELSAALLLSRLMKTVIEALELYPDQVYLWSDSQITLTWIKTEPHKLKVFIANRVSEIQELTENYVWNHVPTFENPADIISRGLMPDQLQNASMWWNGPPMLFYTNEFPSNIQLPEQKFDSNMLELKKEYVNLLTTVTPSDKKFSPELELITYFSSYTRLIRSCAYWLRFKNNCNPKKEKLTGLLSMKELQDALIVLVRAVQNQEFLDEITAIKNNRILSRKSKILSLNPFIDGEGVLRVGGRLENAKISYDQKHQILLPAKGNFTQLVYRHYHEQNCHAGPQLLASLVRNKFWPINGKNTAKNCVRTCVTCFKNKPKITTQIMGNLPSERTEPARPFHTTGIDFCGPFLVKNKTVRNSSHHKVYIAVFVCFVTKGIHLDVVSDLTSEKFLACLTRFISRRGSPHTIWSDNAKTFVGANNDLKQMYRFLQGELVQREIDTYCKLHEINWSFIPPRAPNFGGIWESSVKSLKYHLKRSTTNMIFSYEELYTLTCRIEGILNSRPLTVLSDSPNDPSPITPAHFLCGGPIVAPAEPFFDHVPDNRLTNWSKISKVTQHLWNRFSVEHLHSLQQRYKWKESSPNLQINDIVLIVDDQLPTTQWLLGRITDVVRGPDKKVRVAHIKTKNGSFTRSVSKICKLPIEENK